MTLSEAKQILRDNNLTYHIVGNRFFIDRTNKYGFYLSTIKRISVGEFKMIVDLYKQYCMRK